MLGSGGHDNSERPGGTRDGFPVRRLPVVPPGPRALPATTAGDDGALRTLVDRARMLTEDQPEPFRSLAFTQLLGYLLHDGQEGEPRGRQAPQPIAGPPSTDMQIAEFLAQRRLDSHPDRVAAIAYYHYRRSDGEGITTKGLVDGYTKSRARRPQNFPDVIASCVRKGYLVDGGRRDGMKSWVITATGEAHVEQDL